MDVTTEELKRRAARYAAARGFGLGLELGSGQDGTIWSSDRQSRPTAVKVHRRERG